MKYVFYTLCPIPDICLYLSMRWPNWSIGNEQSPFLSGSLFAFFASIVLTFWGVLTIAVTTSGKEKIGPIIATVIAAIPVVYFIVGPLVLIRRN